DHERAARAGAARRVLRQLGPSGPRVREQEEPDAVRRPDHRVDGREGNAVTRRAAARRGGDLQPAARANATRDRRDAPVRARHPAHEVDPRVAAAEQLPVQHAQAARAATDANRESRPRVHAGRCSSSEGRLPVLRAQAGQEAPLLHGELQGVPGLRERARLRRALIDGGTRLVGLIGDPVFGSLSPRMQNAAFAARGLDWAYVALPVEDERQLEAAVRGLVALGFAGANVTIPYKRAVAELCGADEPSVNTLVVRDGH